MKDFWYNKPTKIIFGRDKVEELGEVISPFGKVLFVYGQNSIKSYGLYERVRHQLTAEVQEYGGVKPNPVISHTREGIELARKVDCILAVGGGSVIDEAKCIAFGALTNLDAWEFFSKGMKPDRALPIIAIPTIVGSGSEMNHGAVLSNEATKQKLCVGAFCLNPTISILDPTLTLTVPRNYTAYGLIDTFCHILEGYLNGEVDVPMQDRLAEGMMLNLLDLSERLLSDLNNYEYRAEAMWASCLANSGLFNVGRGKVQIIIHNIAHKLGVKTKMPHGEIIAGILPGWLKTQVCQKKDKLTQFAVRVMGVDTPELGIKKLEEWILVWI